MSFGAVGFKSTKKLSPFLSGSWLISFGDLLTLLLCFFLTIVSFGPLNPKATLPIKGVTSQSNSVTGPEPGVGVGKLGAGTQVAQSRTSSTENQKELRLVFNVEDFLEPTEKLVPAKVIELQKLIKTDGYSVGRVRLESCSELKSDDQGWFQALSRGFYLRGQFIDAGIEPKRIELRVVGRNCAALKNDPTEFGLAATVNVELSALQQREGD